LLDYESSLSVGSQYGVDGLFGESSTEAEQKEIINHNAMQHTSVSHLRGGQQQKTVLTAKGAVTVEDPLMGALCDVDCMGEAHG
jgi:phage portal protein BeeE